MSSITSPVIVRNPKPLGGPKTRFNQFGLEFSRLLSDDYIHKKFLTVKYAGKGKSFIFNGKGTLDYKLGADKQDILTTSSEVKLVTNIEGTNIETKFDNKGGIRLWTNFGTYNLGRPVNVSAKLKTTNQFNSVSGHVAVEYEAPQFKVLTRVDLKKGNIPFLNEKLLFNYDRFQIGAVAKLNLLAYTLARYNFYIGYSEKNLSIFGEHTSRRKDQIDLGKLAVGAIYRYGGNDYVTKASYRPYKAQQLRFKVGTVQNLNRNTIIRAKINNNAKLSLSSKFKYNSNLNVVAGTQINLLEPATFLTNRTVPIPLGLSFEFNYA